MSSQVVSKLKPEALVEMLQSLGWKGLLSRSGDGSVITSAINGVNFNIRPAGETPANVEWFDFTFSAAFTVDHGVSPVLGPAWNRRHRFARVYRTEKHVFLDMDVILAGGVTLDHVKFQFALWADITNAFLLHLRNDRAALAKANAAKASLEVGTPTVGSSVKATLNESPGLSRPAHGAEEQVRKQSA